VDVSRIYLGRASSRPVTSFNCGYTRKEIGTSKNEEYRKSRQMHHETVQGYTGTRGAARFKHLGR
jgi:hypothetical protein